MLERRERIGGAATLERPFADQRYVVSPCAYVVGLLDRVVVAELELERHGYRVTPADPNLWAPLADGTTFADFLDRERSEEHLRAQGFAESTIAGLRAYDERHRPRPRALRHTDGEPDLWLRAVAGARRGRAPARRRRSSSRSSSRTRSPTLLERHVDDERLRDALFSQGLIGTFAGPRDPGTASIRLMHHQGDLLGLGAVWGYVAGGLGRVSFAIADAALEAGAVIAAGVPVARIVPGEGVELESGELDPRPGRDLERRPEAAAGDARRRRGRRRGGPGRLPGPARGLGRRLAGREAERRAAPGADVPGGGRGLRPDAGDDRALGRDRRGHRRVRRGARAASPRSASASSTSRAPTTTP